MILTVYKVMGQIYKQILNIGFDEEKIYVAPVLKDVYEINIFESQKFDFIFSSGLQVTISGISRFSASTRCNMLFAVR